MQAIAFVSATMLDGSYISQCRTMPPAITVSWLNAARLTPPKIGASNTLAAPQIVGRKAMDEAIVVTYCLSILRTVKHGQAMRRLILVV